MTAKIIFRNLFQKPADSILSILLLLFGIGMISFLLQLEHRLIDKFSRDMQGIDLVLGAKGSPLQLILSAIYQVDAPTGNISLEEADRIRKNPMVAKGIPLAYGDSYRSYRIVGTDWNYLQLYSAGLAQGMPFDAEMEAVVGSDVAKRCKLKLGDKFFGTHGGSEGGHVHKEYAYSVKGILAPTGRVIDQLILTNVSSVWKIHKGHHQHEEEHGEKHDHSLGHDERKHDHDYQDHGDVAEHGEEGKEITAMLITLKSPIGSAILPRMVSDNTDMQAVSPSVEITKLLQIIGIGAQALQAIAIGIMAISLMSVIISLYNKINERIYELALARVMGGSKSKVALLVMTEGISLITIGLIGGLLLSRISFWLLLHYGKNNLALKGELFELAPNEFSLVACVLIMGIAISFIPLVKTYFINLSKTLNHE